MGGSLVVLGLGKEVPGTYFHEATCGHSSVYKSGTVDNTQDSEGLTQIHLFLEAVGTRRCSVSVLGIITISLLVRAGLITAKLFTVKGFGIVKKAEIDVFLELSCFFHDPADVGNLISAKMPQ